MWKNVKIKSKAFIILPVILSINIVTGCTCNENRSSASNNSELMEMALEDQKIRTSGGDEPLEDIDKIHRSRVMELLAESQVKTPVDKFNAALILQHTALTFCNGKIASISPENYHLAYFLSKSAFESGYKDAGYLTAATYDRYLLYTKGYQKYGTQQVYDDKSNELLWAPIDSMTTDAEREKYYVSPLKTLLKEFKMQPFNSISDLSGE